MKIWATDLWVDGFWADDLWIGETATVVKGMQPVIGRRPVRRSISIKSISIALSGPEEPYPHYQFSNRQFFAKPNHNPFKGL